MFDSLDADGRGEMRFTRAWTADQDNVVPVLEELAFVELAHERFVHLTAGEVEAGKVAIVRKVGGLKLVGGRPHLPVGRFRLQELRQDRQSGLEGGRALLGQFADRLSHAVHLESPQHDDDGAGSRIMTHDAPPGSCAERRSVQRWPVARWSRPKPGAPLSEACPWAFRRPACGAGSEYASWSARQPPAPVRRP